MLAILVRLFISDDSSWSLRLAFVSDNPISFLVHRLLPLIDVWVRTHRRYQICLVAAVGIRSCCTELEKFWWTGSVGLLSRHFLFSLFFFVTLYHVQVL